VVTILTFCGLHTAASTTLVLNHENVVERHSSQGNHTLWPSGSLPQVGHTVHSMGINSMQGCDGLNMPHVTVKQAVPMLQQPECPVRFALSIKMLHQRPHNAWQPKQALPQCHHTCSAM